jgi:DNA-binding response OmpR family regulator
MSAYILTVDDDPRMRALLLDALTGEGHEVGQAGSGKQALALIEHRRPDLLVLDIGMPEMDGLAVCRQIRQDTRFVSLPILFLTAHSQPEDVANGLDAGGDDYVTKPIDLLVFQARVRALLRRAIKLPGADQGIADEQAILTIGEVTLNSNTYQVEVQGRSNQLTATEHRLLRYMMEHADQPLSPQHLLEAVWDYPPYTGDPDLVRVHMRNLRAKLEADTRNPKYIQTVHGVGYMIPSQNVTPAATRQVNGNPTDHTPESGCDQAV